MTRSFVALGALSLAIQLLLWIAMDVPVVLGTTPSVMFWAVVGMLIGVGFAVGLAFVSLCYLAIAADRFINRPTPPTPPTGDDRLVSG